jgi:hypothetical protein
MNSSALSKKSRSAGYQHHPNASLFVLQNIASSHLWNLLKLFHLDKLMLGSYRCFLHRQTMGGQDCAFRFRGGPENYEAHYDLSWFRSLLEVIVVCPAVWYWRWTSFTNGWAESSRSSCGERGKWISYPYLKGRGILWTVQGFANYGSIALQSWLSYMNSRAQRLRMLARRGWIGLPRCSYWFPGTEVEGAQDGSWCRRA